MDDSTQMSITDKKSTWDVRVSGFLFMAAACALLLCVVVQVFLAGMAIFVHPRYWAQHTTFVHYFELLPLLMLLLAFAGRLPRRLAWHSFGLYVMIFLQYFFANIRMQLPFIAALHPVMALLIFLYVIYVVIVARAVR